MDVYRGDQKDRRVRNLLTHHFTRLLKTGSGGPWPPGSHVPGPHSSGCVDLYVRRASYYSSRTTCLSMWRFLKVLFSCLLLVEEDGEDSGSDGQMFKREEREEYGLRQVLTM